MNEPTQASDRLRVHAGGLLCCGVQIPEEPPSRVLRWHRASRGLGVVPLFLVRDLGLLLAYPGDTVRVEASPLAPVDAGVDAYVAWLKEFAGLPAVARVRNWGLRDRSLAILIARLLQSASATWRALAERLGGCAGDAELDGAFASALPDLPAAVRAWQAGPRVGPANGFPRADRDAVLRAAARMDAREVQFVELFGGGGDAGLDLQSLVDLVEFAGLSAPLEAVLQDLLSLAPSILGAGRWRNQQPYPVAGISGIALRGSLDNIVPSEFALPEAVFRHRFCNGGLLYYGRERPREDRRRLVWMVVNGGTSMAGDPEILTRVLGLALAKKMSLVGADFGLSMFDETLEPMRPLVDAADLRWFLSHRSERPTRERAVLEGLLHGLKHLEHGYQQITVLLVTHVHFCDCEERHADLLERISRAARLVGILIGSDVEIRKSESGRAGKVRDLSHYLDSRNVLSYAVLRDAERRRQEERRILVEV